MKLKIMRTEAEMMGIRKLLQLMLTVVILSDKLVLQWGIFEIMKTVRPNLTKI
jgi:hypothetical protein